MSKTIRLTGATIDDGQSFLIDAETRQHLHLVGKKGAVSAKTTSLTAVVLYTDGTAITYDLKGCGPRGPVGEKRITNIAVKRINGNDNFLLISFENGQPKLFNSWTRQHVGRVHILNF